MLTESPFCAKLFFSDRMVRTSAQGLIRELFLLLFRNVKIDFKEGRMTCLEEALIANGPSEKRLMFSLFEDVTDNKRQPFTFLLEYDFYNEGLGDDAIVEDHSFVLDSATRIDGKLWLLEGLLYLGITRDKVARWGHAHVLYSVKDRKGSGNLGKFSSHRRFKPFRSNRNDIYCISVHHR